MPEFTGGLPTLQRNVVAEAAPQVTLPESTAAKTWQSIAENTGKLVDVLDKEQAAAEVRYFASFQNDIQGQAIALRDKYAYNPKGFQAAWDQYAGTRLKDIPGAYQEKARALLDDKSNDVSSILTNEKRSRDLALTADSINTRLDDIKAQMLQEAYVSGGVASPKFQQLFSQAHSIQSTAVNLGLTSKESADIHLNNLQDQAKGEAVVGAAVGMYQSQGPDKALKFLQDFATDPNTKLSPEERQSFIARGSALVRARYEQDKEVQSKVASDQAANLDLRIEKAKVSEDPKALDLLYSEIEKNQFLTAPQKSDRLIKILEANKSIEGSAQDAQIVQAQLAGIPILDPTDSDQRKAADKYFTNRLLPEMVDQKLTPDQQFQKTLDFIGKTSVVPNAVKNQLVGGLTGGTPEVKVAMANQITQIIEHSPTTAASFNDQVIATARHMSVLSQGGVTDPQEVVKIVQDAAKQPESLAKMRDKAATSKDALTSNAAFLARQSSFFHGQGRFLNDVKIPDQLAAEYNDMTATFMGQTGDLEVSQKAAWDSMSKVWGVTEIGNGGLRWMKYAPEKFGRPDVNNTKWMQEQLVGDVKTAATEHADPKKLVLEADTLTANAANSGKMPSWSILYIDKNGVFQPMLDGTGKLVRFQPDYKLTPQYKEKVDSIMESYQKNERFKQYSTKSRYPDQLMMSPP